MLLESKSYFRHAAINQRYGQKTRYHAIRKTSPRERYHTLQKNPKLVKKYTRKLSKIFIFTFLQKKYF